MGTGLTEEDAALNDLANATWMGEFYAGSWIDQLNGGKITIATKSGAASGAAAARGLALASDLIQSGHILESDVQFVEHEFSLAEITDAADAFFSGPLQELGDGAYAFVDEPRNTLVIRAEPTAVDSIEQFANENAPGLVTVTLVPEGATSPTPAAAPQSNHSSPHAGVKLNLNRASDNVSGGNCTWGFTARTSTSIYAITAYHCHPDHQWGVSKHGVTSSVKVTVGGQVVSSSGFSYSYNGERGEVTRAQILSLSITDDNNCYHSDSDCNTRISRREYTYETGVGETKCASLRGTNDYRCGTIVSNNWVGTFEGVPMKWIRQITFYASLSDSGGGWKESTRATAITNGRIGSPDWDTLATHMYYVETKLSVTTCGTSGSC